MNQSVTDNLRRSESWSRVLFLIVFFFVYAVVYWLLAAIVLFQAVHLLVFGKANGKLKRFGSSLGEYVRQVIRYLTLDTDELPFPFADWPQGDDPRTIEPPPAGSR